MNLGQTFKPMIFSILGLVLMSALFIPIMQGLASLYGTTGAENFILFQLIITIAPTILILFLTFRLGVSYVRSYQSFSSQDANGLVMMVVGVMEIILFIAMFATVITNFSTLYTTYGSNTTWIAFGTVLTIVPTLLFLGGLFSGGLMVWQGAKKRFGKGGSPSAGNLA